MGEVETAEAFSTLTIVVDTAVAAEFVEILRTSPATREAVRFCTVDAGVSPWALFAGAEPGDWDPLEAD